jgi:hypothetical protein
VFTPLAVGLLLSAGMTAQSVPQTVLDADYVVVLNKSGGPNFSAKAQGDQFYKAALGGDPVGRKTKCCAYGLILRPSMF